MPLTDPVPSSAFDVLERNIQDTDKFVNQETGTFTNRVGKVIKPIPVIESEANAAVISLGWAPVGEFATGFTYSKLNDVGRDASGSWWRYNGSDLPKAITAGTVPSSPDFSVISFETADNVEWQSSKSVGYALDDLQGFTEALLLDAGIVYDEQPDTIGNSQRVDAINKISGRLFDSIATMQSYENPKIGNVYTVTSSIGGADYNITSTSLNLSSLSMQNGLFATPINTTSLFQYGMVGTEGEDITQPILKALANGLKSFRIPQKSVALTQSIDLDGATVNGSNTDLISGALVNGIVNDVHRAPSPIRGGSTSISAASKSATKLMYRETVLDNGSVSPNGEMYSIISPSSCGGVARFTLTNGIGASGANDAGAPYDRLRPVQSFIYHEGFAILRTSSAQSAGVTDSTASLSDTLYGGLPNFQYASDGVKAINAKQVPFNDYVEYSVYGAASTANVVLRTSSGSPTAFEIRVNGELVETVSCVRSTAGVRVVSIPIDLGTSNTIRITNASTGKTGFVWGCNLFNLHELPKLRRGVDKFFDKVVCFGGGRVAAGIGASMDTVVINDAGIYCGSYHGGDVSTSCVINMGRSDGGRFGVKTSTVASPTTPMGAGVYSSDVIITRYNGVIDDANLSIWANYDFSVDGGCYVRFNYQALTVGGSDLSAMYTAMHGSDRGLVNTPLKIFVEATPTNTNTEIPLSISPMLQYSNDGRAVSISTKMYESDYTNIGQYIWDNSQYLKFYYMPIAGANINVKNGDVISSDCLYQLGNAIV